VLRWYELRLLGISGYQPNLHACASCQEPLTEAANRFSTGVGGVVCPRCTGTDPRALPISLAAFKLLRYLQGQSVAAMEHLQLSATVRTEAETLLRAYIRQLLERDLKSITFLEEVQQEG
jgi:DNA repair protein RecO (recombination protein O)